MGLQGLPVGPDWRVLSAGTRLQGQVQLPQLHGPFGPKRQKKPSDKTTTIGDLRVAFRFCFKASPSAKSFIWKLVLFTCKWTELHIWIKLICISKALHLDSLWNRGERQLGNHVVNFQVRHSTSLLSSESFHQQDFFGQSDTGTCVAVIFWEGYLVSLFNFSVSNC